MTFAPSAAIERDSARLAERTVVTLIGAARQLESFPASGRVVPELRRDDVREVLVGLYRVIYRVRATNVRIVMVLHSAQLLNQGELSSRL